MSSAVKAVIGTESRMLSIGPAAEGSAASAALDRAPLQQPADIAVPAVEDLVDGDQLVARDGVEVGHLDRFRKQQLLTLPRRELGRFAAHFGGELELSAALEGAEPAAEVELDAVVAAEARLDVGAAERVSAAGTLAPADLRPENPEDDLLHLGD